MIKEQYQDEKTMVSQVLAGDKRAVRRLYQRIKFKLASFYSVKIQSKEDVEEMVQDTFLHFLDALPLFRFQSNLNTFVMGIARHELMDYWRKKYAKRIIRTVPGIEDMMVSLHDSTLVSIKINQAIEKAYGQLKPIQAQLLRWKYEEDKSVKEIAEVMGWTIKAVEAQLYRSRKAFQEVYVEPEIGA